MTLRVFFLEPESSPAWVPFVGARPISELRAGVWRIRERWAHAVGGEGAGVLGDTARDFQEDGSLAGESSATAPTEVRGPALVVRSDFAPSGHPLAIDASARRLEHAGVTVGWWLGAGESWQGPHGQGPAQEVPGLPLRGAFDLLAALERFLPDDCNELLASGSDPLPHGCIVLGDAARVSLHEVNIEPGVVFDTRHGAIIVQKGAELRHGVRIEGPCFVGPGSRVLGSDVRWSVFGPRCVVRGEVSVSCFTGYANKAHDGFVGHSVLGHWVNLGAGTTTSNLKNTYGTVRVRSGTTEIETGRQFLGSLIGDHAKTAIGTMLPTGTIVGAGASVFGPGLTKYVPPFAWGADAKAQVDEEGFVRIAERVMPRREVEVTPAVRASLKAIYARLARK